MKRIFVMSVLIIFLVNILTGCLSSEEINELSIAMALGIDESEEGYLVTAQIINPEEISTEISSGNRTPVTTFQTTGETIAEALRKLTLETPRRVYVGHLKMLVFGEELAKNKGIGNALDFLSRNYEIRPDFYIMVTKEVKAEEVLSILTPLEKIPADTIYHQLETSEELYAPTHHVDLNELTTSMLTEGMEPVLTGIYINGSSETGAEMQNLKKVDMPTTIQIGFLGAFKKDKLIGWLDEEESIGFNHIMGRVKSTIVVLPWPDGGKIGAEITRIYVTVRVKVESGVPKIVITNRVKANIGDVETDVDLLDEKNIEEIEKILASEIKRKMYKAVEKAQKDLDSDIFGFGEVIHRANPKVWKDLKENWDEVFASIEVDINVITKIRRLGSITESFKSNKE